MKRNHLRIPRWTQRLQSIAARLLAAPLFAAGVAIGAPVPDRLTLLVPDTADLNSWQVKVWTDSAAEEGLTMQVIRDKDFLALSGIDAAGATIVGSSNKAAATIGGLIVPDSAHIQASNGVVAAVTQYTNLGGRLMLVYDAGALDERNFYSLTGKSRFSALVGVDYLLYESLRDKVAGFGPVVGTRARLESLAFPPGKYLPYLPPASLAMPTNTTAFVPTSSQDPGGTQAMRSAIQQRAAKGADEGSDNVRAQRRYSLRRMLGIDVDVTGPVRFDRRVANASNARDKHIRDNAPRSTDWVNAVLSADLSTAVETAVKPVSAADTTLQAISGYAYGPLGYFSYVTTGDITANGGTVYLSSPEHGLVAGARSVGSGKLLFVNLPLGYFKAIGTDSAPLHGFLNLFAREQVGMPRLSVQPAGRGGLVFNWHVDAGSDLNVDVKALLKDESKILERGAFSIHFTAGPDVIAFGDGQGMDLPNNKSSQDLVKKLFKLKINNDNNNAKDDESNSIKHELGSHGGWIHDFWGLNANETNEASFTTYLVQNFAAIENVIGRKLREYSAPAGNNPKWAVKWIEDRGVAAFYTVGDGGAAAVRPWREGQRLTTNMWAIPVTPLGRYATFEEFADPLLGNITDRESGQWLIDLQSFTVNMRTNRMFYNHPPGARGHMPALKPLLDRADKLKQSGQFSWYTMAQIADFSQRRLGTTWRKTTDAAKLATFVASHPSSLQDVTWLLPRSTFGTPKVTAGKAIITSDALNWVVAATSGTSLSFSATER